MIAVLQSQMPGFVVVAPLLAAALAVCIDRRASWTIAFCANLVALAGSVVLLTQTLDGSALFYHLGGWAPPVGIEYRIDALNALVLVIVSFLSAISLIYARESIPTDIPGNRQEFFYAAWLLYLTGLLGVTISGDMFNVFVFLEISSLASTILIAAGAGRDRRALVAAYRYLFLSTIGATFFVMGVGFLYALTGTLNMADLAQKLIERGDSSTLRMAFAFIFVGLGLKLAMIPLHLWMPGAYRFAPSAVAVFMAATGTKVMLYILMRVLFGVFGFNQAFENFLVGDFLLLLAVLAILSASLVAIWQDDLKRMLAWSSIAQIGYILLGISMLSHAGVMASVVHIFNHALAKGALFMLVGAFVFAASTSSARSLAGIGRDMPWTMAGFVIAGLSLIGVPLTVGFVSKWYLVQAAFMQGSWLIAFFVVATSLLTAVYIWRFVEIAYFRASPEGSTRREAPATLLIPAWALVGLCIYFGIDTDLTSSAASRAANALIGASNLFWQ